MKTRQWFSLISHKQRICFLGTVAFMVIIIGAGIFRLRIDNDRCIRCGACIKACPSMAAKGRVYGSKLPPDCFSCARCLNVCPVDAIKYESVFKKITRNLL
ncbi:MAG: 4Fe-4S binding protein [Kiritimatiellia bacterium]